MKTLKLLSVFVFALCLIGFASAVDVDGQWEDGSQQPITITEGESVNFIAESFSTYSSSILNIKLYDSQDNEIYPFEKNKDVGKNVFFSQQYEINSSIYKTSGSYKIVIEASDNIPSNDNLVLDLTVESIDTNPPVITITSPEDGQTYDSHITELTYTVTDEHLDSCWYSVDGGETTVDVDCNEIITGLQSVEGENTWTVYAIDTAGNQASESVTFSVEIEEEDTTAPEITILSPKDGETYTSPIEYLYFVVIDENLDYCLVNDNPVSCNSEELTTIEITSVEGTNTWTVYAVDDYGNEAEVSVTFTIDTSVEDTDAPIIIIISPENKKYETSTIELKIIINEDAEVWFNLNNGEDITMSNPENHIFVYTLTVVDGEHKITFYAKDKAGNQASATVEFSIDTSEKTEDKKKKTTTYFYQSDYDEQLYLNQFKNPKIIYLEDDEQPEKILNWFQKFIEWLKNLFGF